MISMLDDTGQGKVKEEEFNKMITGMSMIPIS